MNTTEIITKLRAQAAELNAMADALEEATENAAFATGAGRYLIHGAVKVGDWTTWENVPSMTLVEDAVGDYAMEIRSIVERFKAAQVPA
jgi:phosphate uptake regulator